MLGGEQLPTRSAILQLREEQAVISEAYDFLDEKRLLLAAELLKNLNQYEELLTEYKRVHQSARAALIRTIERHGLHGTQIYPSHFLADSTLQSTSSQFMGVSLLKSRLEMPDEQEPLRISNASPEASASADLFVELTTLVAVLASLSGNLHRLLAEYRRTERRARALENVVIPEINETLMKMSVQLEEMDQEDIIRIHLNKTGS
jgi:V/A-type H+-transporting ATPase subunit D